mgnify:CR=1 FL=1
MLEQELISLAAPTLAGIKPGSLFSMQISPDDLTHLRTQLPDLRLVVLAQAQKKLLYLFRRFRRTGMRSPASVCEGLLPLGYTSFTIGAALHHLRTRLAHTSGFPHEIGIFLGYPLEDVQGFIQHHGQNCLLSGCWKVYTHAEAAQRTFAAYRTCRQQLLQRYAEGVPLRQLIVQAHPAAAAPPANAPQYQHSTGSSHGSSHRETPDTRRRTAPHAPLRKRVPDNDRSAPIPARIHPPQCSPDTHPAGASHNPCSTHHRP